MNFAGVDHGGRKAAVILFSLGLAQSCSVGSSTRLPPPVVQELELTSAGDRSRIEALAARRATAPPDAGYRLGPDDLLDIRIPDLTEAQAPAATRAAAGSDPPVVSGAPAYQQGVRVNGGGQVQVPMLGLVPVTGLTPTELERDLARRLVDAGILRAPQVNVLVAEYRSHVAAVTGSVEHPGLYPLTRPGATLADLVWAAGGPTRDAGRLLEFVPTPDAASDDRSPIHLDLESLLHPSGEGVHAANVPARPGDVISLAPAGSVLVDGWVEKPGSYPVTRGLTVAGALAAAGGHSFAADRHHAVVKRILASGEDRSFSIDLEAVAQGFQADVPVVDGDVVRLPASTARVVPWGFWTVAREMIHVGGNVLLF